MSVFAISMVRDEADIIAGMLTHLAGEVDHILIADNNSTDGTAEIIAELDLPLTLRHDTDPAYYQSEKMSLLAEMAGSVGADWIVPVDADELWYAEDRISVVLADMPDAANIVTATLYNHFPTAIDPEGIDPFETIVWRQRKPGALPKVAFRYELGAVVEQGNHGVQLADPVRASGLTIRHFPYRSEAQFIRKARNGAEAYKRTDLPESYGLHWRSYGQILDRFGEEALGEVFRTHFHFMSPIDHEMTFDPAPYLRWQITDGLEESG